MGLYKKLFRKRQKNASSAITNSPKPPRPQQHASDTVHSEPPSDTALPPSLWRDAASQLGPKEQAKLNALLKSKRITKDGEVVAPTMADVDLVISRTKELKDGDRLATWRPVSFPRFHIIMGCA